MKRLFIIAAVVVAMSGLGFYGLTTPTLKPAQSPATEIAGARTVTFAVENMFCALCPLTVHKAIERVAGVKSVEVDYKSKTAVVIFDPAVTSIDAIASASTNAGYPAAEKG